MLRKFFSGGGTPPVSTPTSHPPICAPATCDDAKLAVPEAAADDASDFPRLVSRLEDFEGRLKATVNTLSRHCQAITEISFSSKNLDQGLHEMYGVTEPQQQEQEQKSSSSSSWIPLIAEFRTSTIAPLQAILADIPQLKVFCDHRNSALAVKRRYDKKIEEIQSTTRYESSRLQRNRAKQHAAAIRFKEIDDKVRSDISRLLARDVAELLGDSLEKILVDAQRLVAKRLEANALELQVRIESFKSIAAEKAKRESPTISSSEQQQQPKEPATVDATKGELSANQEPPPPVLELAEPPADVESTVSSMHIMPKHILSEEHSVCPRKKHVYGTRTWNLHRHIKDSMATGLDITECIQLPEGYQLEEWVAVHVIDFFNEISLLFGTISEFCTVNSCPQMTAGPCYTYLWADGKQQVAPIALPAPEYVSRLLNWVQEQLDDPQVFPPDGDYDSHPRFLQAASVIFKRLFRVYAHMYHNHLDSYVALHAESHLNFCFKRFIFFVKEFQMIDQKELNALRKLIQTLVSPSAQVHGQCE